VPLLKRASERLEKMGIAIEVHMGPYGPYLHDPFLRRQRTYVYKSAEEAVQAALHGVRPRPDYETRADGWPLCPSCGEDELWSPLVWEDVRPSVEAFIAAGLTCYRCHWTTKESA
jgi:hypothetical protein